MSYYDIHSFPLITPPMQVEINKKLDAAFGKYTFEVPPVCTAYWDFDSWAKWILSTGTVERNLTNHKGKTV